MKYGCGSTICYLVVGLVNIVKVEDQMRAAKFREILVDSLGQSARELLGREYLFSSKTIVKCRAKIEDNKMNVLELFMTVPVWLMGSPRVLTEHALTG